MQCMLRLVSQDGFAPEGMQPPLHEPTDAALLDAYSTGRDQRCGTGEPLSGQH
jgi:hypothetical protein